MAEVIAALAAHLAACRRRAGRTPRMTRRPPTTVEVGARRPRLRHPDRPGPARARRRRIAARLPGVRAAIVTDENVAPHHLGAAARQPRRRPASPRAAIVLPAGEKTKSFARLQEVVRRHPGGPARARRRRHRARRRRHRRPRRLRRGIVRRGMHFVQIPTSLLAQVDSSVGGKTGINSPHGKNLVGAFHQPQPGAGRHRRARHAAAARVPRRLCRGGQIRADRPAGLLRLAGGQLARRLCRRRRRATEAIAVALPGQGRVVARDESETGDRALLNLGHTFGHALEAATGYDGARLLHGEGVAIGMALAHRFSARLGPLPARTTRRASRRICSAVGLPTRIARHPRRRCRTPTAAGLPSRRTRRSSAAR